MSVKRYLYFLLIAVLCWSPCYGDWESDANARIEQIRKRNAEITVVDSLGYPVPGVNVQIEQIGHHFAFGTCITNGKMTDPSYKNFILDHFEWAVCENETKWNSNESTRDSEDYSQADNIYQWANSNGLKFRGHTLFWEQVNWALPTWVQSLSCAEMPAEVNERIDSAVNHYKNKFRHWDVDNEMLTDNFFGPCLGEAGRVNMFERAKLRDPNCLMFMNEYKGNSFDYYSSSDYVTRATSLIGMGAPIDALGIQGHLGANVVFYPQAYYSDVLQPLATLGLPIWATEFDARHTDENVSADNIENYFRICFSHPSVEGIIMWGFLEGSMWRADAYLVTTSWVLTERGERYEALMDEWTTNDSNTTNSLGKVSFRGFHGTYKITLSKPGQPTEIYTIELEPGQTPAQFVLKRYASDVEILGSWGTGTTHAKESGTNRALVFIAHARRNSTSSTNLTSVTYGGRAMTKVVEKITSSASNPRIYTAAFILNDANITAASNTTFVPTWSGTPSYTAYGSVFLSNVNQSALTGATAGDEITTTVYMLTTPMLATSAGDMVIEAATNSATGTYTMNNSFTKGQELAMTTADAVEGYKIANGAEEIPSVTHTATNTRQTAIGFVVVRAPANEFILSDCNAVLAADYGLNSDIFPDCYVNSKDLKIISDYWLNTNCTEPSNCGGADFELDGDVDFVDFSDFAMQWLLCNNPEDANCTPNW